MCYSAIPKTIRKARSTPADIEALADKLAPGLAKAIFEALDGMKDDLDLDDLAAALASGDLNAVFSILDAVGTKELGMGLAGLQDAAWAGGALAAVGMTPRVGGVVFEFDRLNPALTTWLRDYRLNLIREINETTKEGVRGALMTGMQGGKNPRVQAREIKEIVGLTRRQSAAVGAFRKELETFHLKRSAKGWGLKTKIDRAPGGDQVFKPGKDGKPQDGILERRLRDFRSDGVLQRSLDTGKALKPEQIDKMVAAYQRKYLKYRAETIARTEAMRALNMGVVDAWHQAVAAGTVPEVQVRRFWKVGKDERTCAICNAIPGMNAKGVALAKPFATPKGAMMMGPVHPDCRCHQFIRMIEPEEFAAYGIGHNGGPA